MAVQKTKTSPGSGRKKPSSGRTAKINTWPVLFWLVFAIIVLGLFVFNRDTIIRSVQIIKSEFEARKADNSDEKAPDAAVVLPAAPPPAASAPAAAAAVQPASPRPAPQTESPSRQTSAPPTASASTPPAAAPSPSAQAAGSSPASPELPQTSPQAGPSPAELPERTLHFIRVDSDGDILRIRVNRRFPVSDTPMTDVIQALIAGPTAMEKQSGLISLIPPETQILSATVTGSTAQINFNEDFLYNTYGAEGYAGQVRQIVFTATEFSTVNDVQILIEGRLVDYLGGGVWIGGPLRRDMF